jgi:hypothetical protein
VVSGAIRDDRDDRKVVLAKRRAAGRRTADLDLRVRLAPVSLDDHDVAPEKTIITF